MSLRSKLGRLAAALQSDAVRAELAPPSMEPLEPRLLMAAHPVISYIPNQTVRAGSPLYIPLHGSDADGDAITWTVMPSDPGVMTSAVPRWNRSLQITMGDAGSMTFQLFEDKAPRATSRIIELANSGFYDGVTFHRVIDGFMIQGGDPTGTGGGGSPLPDFDDQFHVDLQHNRAGLLSMAKSGDDTNDSQFFITDAPTRWLDYNHTIFGLQTSGDALREAISATPVDANDKPLTPQVMTDVSVFRDTQNGVAMLKAPAGVTSGTTLMTVRARDATGRVTFRRFYVTVQPDTENSPPFLLPMQTLRTERGVPFTFRMTSADADGGTPYYDASFGENVPDGTDGQINRQNGTVTITPPANFTGSFDIVTRVRDANVADSGDAVWDYQTVTVHVVPPVAPDAWDAGRGDDTAGTARFIGHHIWQLNRTIDAPTDGDWVRFTLAERSRVIVRAAGTNGTDVRLLLRGPNRPGAIPGSPDTGVAAEGAALTTLVRAGAKALEAGIYWLRVDGFGSVVPNYHLRVETLALPAAAPAATATASADVAAAAAAWDRLRRQDADEASDRDADGADALLEAEPVLAFLA